MTPTLSARVTEQKAPPPRQISDETAQQADSLDAITRELLAGGTAGACARGAAGCTACGLAATRNTIVVGEGSPQARIVFVGEGPGEQEDLQARPFVGKAGQLLTRMIEALGLRREDVYICNVVKCRPPGNRNPEPAEVAACSPYLHRQLAALKPEVIVALGKFAAQTLLQTDVGIMRLRGTFAEYRGIPVMPTFHPSYLLRTPGAKREAWDDLKQVAAKAGLEIPARRGAGEAVGP